MVGKVKFTRVALVASYAVFGCICTIVPEEICVGIAPGTLVTPAPLPEKVPMRFTPLEPLVTRLDGNCASAIVTVMFAAATEPALAALAAWMA